MTSARTLIIFTSLSQLTKLMHESLTAFSECDALLLDCAEQIDEHQTQWLREQFRVTYHLKSLGAKDLSQFSTIDYDEWAQLSIQYAHTVFWPLA
jgi:hypothetical protein